METTCGTFHLGEWLVEPTLNRVSRDDITVQLEQRVMAVLIFLSRHAGELVTRRNLVDSVWDEGFVADNTITHAVTELRKAFRDNARDPLFIETIHRRGYRLIAPVAFNETPSVMSSGAIRSFLAIVRDLEIPLHEGVSLIGRSPDVEITIRSMKVSRHHARITVAGRSASLEDLDSKNGTFLNGTRVNQELPLSCGDLISIGRVTETILFVAALEGGTTEPEFDA